jgi:hypothetical protein
VHSDRQLILLEMEELGPEFRGGMFDWGWRRSFADTRNIALFSFLPAAGREKSWDRIMFYSGLFGSFPRCKHGDSVVSASLLVSAAGL